MSALCGLAQTMDLPPPITSHHLQVDRLERAGLITRGRDAQMRPCKIEASALIGVDDWLAEYRRLWEARLDRLDDYLQQLKAQQASARESGDDGKK